MDGPEAGQTYTCQNFGTGGTGATISGCSEQSYLNWDSLVSQINTTEQ